MILESLFQTKDIYITSDMLDLHFKQMLEAITKMLLAANWARGLVGHDIAFTRRGS